MTGLVRWVVGGGGVKGVTVMVVVGLNVAALMDGS